MYASFFECSYGSYVRMYYQKTFDAIIATPVTIEDVIAGELLWGATRSMINAAVMVPVIALFGLIDTSYALLIIPFAFLGGLLFGAIGTVCFTAVTLISWLSTTLYCCSSLRCSCSAARSFPEHTASAGAVSLPLPSCR